MIAVLMRATALYNRACGRVPFAVCMQRAALTIRIEQGRS